MAIKKQQAIEPFTSTCDKDYDRHSYRLVLNNGKAIVFKDYEHVRAYWYQYKEHLKCVEVL